MRHLTVLFYLLIGSTTSASESPFQDRQATTSVLSVVSNMTDSDGDGVPDTEDCAPNDWRHERLPRECSNLMVKWHTPGDKTSGLHIETNWETDWGGEATDYDGVQGNISDLWEDRGFDRALCLPVPFEGEPWFDDYEPGNHYYLIRMSSCGEYGTFGESFGGFSPTVRNFRLDLDLRYEDGCP